MANNNRQNYFDQSIRQFGDDFIMMLSPEKIQRAAKTRIFREMVQGNIDYSKYGKYFTDPKFFENLFIAAYDECINNTIILSALREYDFNHPGDNRVVIMIGKYQNLVYVYQILYNSLYTMKMNDYNVGILSNVSAMLYQYRNQL